jgi:hypothetical protein
MLKLCRYEIAFGFLVGALAANIFWGSMLSSLPPQYNTENQQSTEGADKKPAQISADDRIANYTEWLAVLTGGLVVVSAIQIRFLIRSDKTARISGDAAKQSADATIALERPYFFAAEAALVQSNGPTDPIRHITYSITNLGRVPGVLRMSYVEAMIREAVDPIATYRKDKFMYAQNPIGGGQKLIQNQLPPVSFDEAISERDYTDAKNGGNMVMLKILLVYSGPLDFTYYSAAMYRIDLNTGHNYAIGGPVYNYEITEKGRPTATTVLTPEIHIIP